MTVLVDTPLVASRSLGALLGFGALAFKLETCQPTGSWLDREAAALVQQTVASGLTGLCVVSSQAHALALGVQCARVGLRLVVLWPDKVGQNSPGRGDGWLAALGARQIAMRASLEEIAAVAEQIAASAGLRLVGVGPPHDRTGLEDVASEIEVAGLSGSVLAVPALSGKEPAILARMTEKQTAAVPLPLDDLAGPSSGRTTRPFAVVGHPVRVGPAGGGTSPAASVLSVPVSAREAEAARMLLAREEGLIVSATGATALAALVRAVREDRARRPRERRFPRDPEAVAVLVGDPLGIDGSNPPRAADTIAGRAVTLAELMANPQRLLVEPPGSNA